MADRIRDPRMRSAVVALLLVALLASFSVACVGGDTPEVQKPVNQTRNNYEQFLVHVGVIGRTGQIAAPWIVTPEEGQEVSGRFEVSGWSARPMDTLLYQSATEAYVRVYVVPSQEFRRSGYRGYEVTSFGREAPIDLKTGAWSLDLESVADTYVGECTIVVVTHITGSAGGGQESPPSAITVRSSDGASKGGGQAWPQAQETLYLACVMVEPKGETFSPGSQEELRTLVGEVQRYYRDVSRGRLAVELIELQPPRRLEHADSKYEADDATYLAHIADAVSWIPPDKLPPKGAIFSLVAVQPGGDARHEGGRSTHSISWPFLGQNAYPWRGSFINLPLDQPAPQDMIGVLAHEIAHGLGSFPGTEKNSLPDLYENTEGNYTPANFNNFDEVEAWTGRRVGDYFVMARNRAVSPSSYSQEWLGWLKYESTPLAALANDPSEARQLKVPYIDGLHGTVDSAHRITWTESDDRSAYTIIEARSRRNGHWESRLPASGVAVYKLREAKGERLSWQTGWPASVNWCTLLDSGNRSYIDIFAGYGLRLNNGLSGGASEGVTAWRLPIVVDSAIDWLKDVGSAALTGATMVPEIPDIDLGSAMPLSARALDSTGTPKPDLDLHAYLADGTHIGMDYETGVFVNPVEGALVSGDMVMDAEWILLPPELAEGARFEVSSRDTQVFAEAFPGVAEGRSLDIGYDVQPVFYDEVGQQITRGEAVEGSLAPGAVANTVLAGRGRLELTPLQPGSGAPTGIAAIDPLVWELGGAALLILLAILVLLIPLRRR